MDHQKRSLEKCKANYFQCSKEFYEIENKIKKEKDNPKHKDELTNLVSNLLKVKNNVEIECENYKTEVNAINFFFKESENTYKDIINDFLRNEEEKNTKYDSDCTANSDENELSQKLNPKYFNIKRNLSSSINICDAQPFEFENNVESEQGDKFKDNVGKYVRANHVQTDEHWTKHWKNNLINYSIINNCGTIVYFPSAGSSIGMSSGDAPDSICPRGWILATYSGNKSYYNLISDVYGRINGSANYNADSILHIPLSFLRSGNYNYDGGSRNNRNSNGNYWESRTYLNSNVPYAYYLVFFSTNLNPQNGNNRGNGFSVRCVSRS